MKVKAIRIIDQSGDGKEYFSLYGEEEILDFCKENRIEADTDFSFNNESYYIKEVFVRLENEEFVIFIDASENQWN